MRGEQHTDRELQHLLAVAGAIVSLDAIAAWKRYEFAEASTWAAAQIAADEQAPRGRRISVRWPTCVAIAVYGTAAEGRTSVNSHAIYLTQTPGRCRWCRCTHDNPCAEGCGWANREQTLCTGCVPLDRAMKNAPGRMELAEFLQEHDFLAGGRQHAELTRSRRLKAPVVRAKACARKGCHEPRLPRHQLCRIHSMSKTATS